MRAALHDRKGLSGALGKVGKCFVADPDRTGFVVVLEQKFVGSLEGMTVLIVIGTRTLFLLLR